MFSFKGMWHEVPFGPRRFLLYSNRDCSGRYFTRLIDTERDETILFCFHETFNGMVRQHLKLKGEFDPWLKEDFYQKK